MHFLSLRCGPSRQTGRFICFPVLQSWNILLILLRPAPLFGLKPLSKQETKLPCLASHARRAAFSRDPARAARWLAKGGQARPAPYPVGEKSWPAAQTPRAPGAGGRGRAGGRCAGGDAAGCRQGPARERITPSSPRTARGAGHHGTQVRQKYFSQPKSGRQADPERVGGKHKATTEDDFNFQEQIIATSTQPQTKYFQANLYGKGIKSGHCKQLSGTLNNEIWL